MSLFGNIESFINQNPALAKLATNAISGLTSSPKPAPKLVTQAPAVQVVSVPTPGMSTTMKYGIGAGVVLVAVLMVVLLGRRR